MPDFNLLNKLMHLKIEVSAQCNSRCIMCYPKTSFEKRGWGSLMDFDLFKKIIDEVNEEFKKPIDLEIRQSILNKISYKDVSCAISKDAWLSLFKGKIIIFIYGIGEPFLNPNFLDMLSYIKSLENDNFYIVLNTNCSAFDESSINKLLDLEIIDELNLSIDSHDKNIFEKIRKGLSYDIIIHNVFLLLKVMKNKDVKLPKVKVVAIRLPENNESLKETEIFFKDLGLDFAIFEDIRNRQKVQTNYICPKFNHSLMVCADGKIIKCIFDYDGCTYIGNAKKTSLKEIWNGKEHKKLLILNNEKRLDEIKICKEVCLE